MPDPSYALTSRCARMHGAQLTSRTSLLILADEYGGPGRGMGKSVDRLIRRPLYDGPLQDGCNLANPHLQVRLAVPASALVL
jgi:hypothetical protein